MGYQHRVPLLTAGDEVDLARRMERGREAADRLACGEPAVGDDDVVADGRAAKTHFIEANVRLALSMANKVRVPPHVDRQDVVQDAMLGLETAVERFDWRRGYKFSTYATWWIRRAIQAGLEYTEAPVRVPSHKAIELRTALAGDVAHAQLSPSLQAAARAGAMESLDRELVDSLTVGDLVASADDSPDEVISADADVLAVRALLGELEGLSREMVVARFGLGGAEPQTYTAIAEAHGLSTEAVRRRVLRALDALQPLALQLTSPDEPVLTPAA